MEGRIEQHEKLGKGGGSKGENGGKKEEIIQVISGRKVSMPRQPASKGLHRLCDVCERRVITPCRMEKTL